MPDPETRLGYLEAVAGALRLDPETEDAVLDELDAHLEDSTSGLMAGGRTHADAEREALRRLGDPVTLATQIRRAHQTKKRLLAAVGGSVLGAADGAVRASVPWIVVSIIATFACLVPLGVYWAVTNTGMGAGTSTVAGRIDLAIVIPVAFGASRRASAALARIGHRTLRFSSIVVGVAGALGLLALFLFGLRVTMGPSTAALEVAVVVAWLAGAASVGRVEDLTMSRRQRYALIGILTAVLFLVLGPLASSGTTDWDNPGLTEPDLGRIGTPLAEADRPQPLPDIREAPEGVAIVGFEPPSDPETLETEGAFPASLTEPRLELWAATALDNGSPFAEDTVGPLDPAVSGSVRTAPMITTDRTWTGSMRYDDIPGLDRAWLVTTALQDGRRVIVRSEALVPMYQATLWDWLTAPSARSMAEALSDS